MHSRHPIHTPNRKCQQSAYTPSECRTDKQIPNPQAKLFLCIEKGQIDRHSRKQACFHGSEEDSADNELGEVVDKTSERADDSPQSRDKRDPDARSEFLQYHIGRRLEDDVCYEDEGHGGLVLVSVEVKVFFHAVETCVPDIDSGVC